MALYIVRTNEIKNRKASAVFYTSENQWHLYRNNQATPLFPCSNQGIGDYRRILEYAGNHELKEIEIRPLIVSKEKPDIFPEILEYLAEQASIDDISIGILKQNSALLTKHRELLNRLGIYVLPSPRRAEPLDTDGAVMESPRVVFAACGPVPKAMASHSIQKAKLSFGEIHLGESFQDRLMKHLIAPGKTNAEIYQRSGVSKQVFSIICLPHFPHKKV